MDGETNDILLRPPGPVKLYGTARHIDTRGAGCPHLRLQDGRDLS